jgi:hypothetical protein
MPTRRKALLSSGKTQTRRAALGHRRVSLALPGHVCSHRQCNRNTATAFLLLGFGAPSRNTRRHRSHNSPDPATAVDEAALASLHSWNILGTSGSGMLPLYAARIEDLEQGDFVKVDCAACPPRRAADAGGAARGRAQPRDQGSRPQRSAPVPGCGRKGRAVVSIKWRGQSE